MVSGDIPTYRELMLPVIRAVDALGGSGSNNEISERAIVDCSFGDDMVGVSYPNNEKSVLRDRLDWARSYCKLGGALESPKRGLFLLTDLGRGISAMSDEEATTALLDLDKGVRTSRRRRPSQARTNAESIDEDDAGPTDDSEDEGDWKDQLLQRLHQLSPDAFERFALYLLRSYGMELERRGGSGDEGIDGLGTMPLTPVLSRTVAVQAKRYEPTRTVGREVVALFQSDSVAVGAEHGVLITTARFSAPARMAALGRTPTIDLIDGDRLAELVREREIGIKTQPVVQHEWFDRFED